MVCCAFRWKKGTLEKRKKRISRLLRKGMIWKSWSKLLVVFVLKFRFNNKVLYCFQDLSQKLLKRFELSKFFNRVKLRIPTHIPINKILSPIFPPLPKPTFPPLKSFLESSRRQFIKNTFLQVGPQTTIAFPCQEWEGKTSNQRMIFTSPRPPPTTTQRKSFVMNFGWISRGSTLLRSRHNVVLCLAGDTWPRRARARVASSEQFVEWAILLELPALSLYGYYVGRLG